MPGLVYAKINCSLFDYFRKSIAKRDISEEKPDWCKSGIENDSHLTLYYGINPEVQIEDVRESYKAFFSEFFPLSFHPDTVTFFPTPKWDCLVVGSENLLSQEY